MSATTAAAIPAFCGLCIARCGSIATVEDGRFTRLDPDPTHPTGKPFAPRVEQRRSWFIAGSG